MIKLIYGVIVVIVAQLAFCYTAVPPAFAETSSLAAKAPVATGIGSASTKSDASGTSSKIDVNHATAIEQIRATLDEVVKIVESLPGEENTKARRDQLRTLLESRFNFEEMSKRSLGTHWRDRTEPERKEFVALFSDLLSKTYMGRIEEVKSGMVRIRGESTDGTRATVKTVVQNKGESFPIDYKLIKQNDRWRVYDVVIENIGLVSNYRNEFAGIIRKEEFSGLIKRLQEKNASS